MKVLKFGGTSLGNAQRIKHVADLITREKGKVIVVLSAVSGTTNSLVAIAESFKKGAQEEGRAVIENLRAKYHKITGELFKDEMALEEARGHVHQILGEIATLGETPMSDAKEKEILAKGEMISTMLMHRHLQLEGRQSILLSALDYMKTVENEPDQVHIQEQLTHLLSSYPSTRIFITQGYICRNEAGEVDNLQRGGSDYTASLVGAAIQATEIQIWTDIDGMHNNDPRVVAQTYPVHELSFDEAAELAYFGAKILHPSSVLPAQKANIPVRLLNTLQPDAQGTIISSLNTQGKIKAVAAKDGIVAIKIKSSRMLLAYGFLRRVFEIFEKYRTPIDMITTSEVAVSLTIDNTSHLEEILTELRVFGIVEFDKNQSIICVVGHFLQQDTSNAARVLNTLKNIPIRMISYGGSKNNISLLVHQDYKQQALQALNDGLFFTKKNLKEQGLEGKRTS